MACLHHPVASNLNQNECSCRTRLFANKPYVSASCIKTTVSHHEPSTWPQANHQPASFFSTKCACWQRNDDETFGQLDSTASACLHHLREPQADTAADRRCPSAYRPPAQSGLRPITLDSPVCTFDNSTQWVLLNDKILAPDLRKAAGTAKHGRALRQAAIQPHPVGAVHNVRSEPFGFSSACLVIELNRLVLWSPHALWQHNCRDDEPFGRSPARFSRRGRTRLLCTP